MPAEQNFVLLKSVLLNNRANGSVANQATCVFLLSLILSYFYFSGQVQ